MQIRKAPVTRAYPIHYFNGVEKILAGSDGPGQRQLHSDGHAPFPSTPTRARPDHLAQKSLPLSRPLVTKLLPRFAKLSIATRTLIA